MSTTHHDVLIVGAGISGISAACHLKKECPSKTFAILEAREALGGTWDLFRYPGIRSDSDMYTLGYCFRPWTEEKAIAAGETILSYLQDTAREYDVERHMHYGCIVRSASWSSRDARWTVTVEDARTSETSTRTCDFLFMCAGYYAYDAGYTPVFEGAPNFRGRIVHPQNWTPDVDYDDRRVVVIGSGATAVTLVPELAKRASHVTMLQRSPTYIVARPATDAAARWLRERLPPLFAHALARWKNVFLTTLFYNFCRKYPERAKRLLLHWVRLWLGSEEGIEEHFTPQYAPWDQRVCLVPDGDLFTALRSGKAEVVTDHIERFTETGILLRSGRELPADLIVTATGLRLRFLGGVELSVDGARRQPPDSMVYKGMMLSDVPNLALAMGYTNASWTLKCDLTSEYVCRLLNHMDANGYASCCPRKNDPAIRDVPILDFSSGYVQRSLAEFPTQGSAAPFRLYQNYALDVLALRHSPVEDGTLVFS